MCLSPGKHFKGLRHHLYMAVLLSEEFASAKKVNGGLGVRMGAAVNNYQA